MHPLTNMPCLEEEMNASAGDTKVVTPYLSVNNYIWILCSLLFLHWYDKKTIFNNHSYQ